jgi:transcriptional regulator NrdR family protein
MEILVVKKNGQTENFDINKIKKAIENAASDAGYEEGQITSIVEDVSHSVLESIKDLERVDTSSLKNLILSILDNKYPNISKAWRDYDSQVKSND